MIAHGLQEATLTYHLISLFSFQKSHHFEEEHTLAFDDVEQH